MNIINITASNVKYSITNGTNNPNISSNIINGVFSTMNRYIRGGNGSLHYISNTGFKSRIVQAIYTNAMQTLNANINNAIPAYKRELEAKQIQKAVEKNQSTIKIINNGKPTKDNGACITDSGVNIYAIDKYGQRVKEAIMLSIPSDTPVNFQQTVYDYGNAKTQKTTTTINKPINKIIWYDLTPNLSFQCDKNVIVTKVQGRDYSRKELVSGGDFDFTISGKMVSGYPDVYPTEDVQSFIQIMKYNGVIEVSNPFFNTLNINKIIIKNFSCNSQEGNGDTQPYSFSCVAVEPDSEIKVSSEVINSIDLSITQTNKSGWLQALLKNKLEEIETSAANSASTIINNTISNII